MWRVAPLVFRAPRGVLLGRAAWCARGRRPASLMVLRVAPLVFRAPSGPAAREIATREPAARSGRSRSPPVPARALRRPPVPPAPSTPVGPGALTCGLVRRLEARPGPATAHGHRSLAFHPSGALHTGGAWCADVWFGALARCLAGPRSRPRAPQPGPVGQLGRLSETVVAFACWYLYGVETGVAFAGAKWVFLVHFSGAEVMPVSAVPC